MHNVVMSYDISEWQQDHFNDPYRPGKGAVAIRAPHGSRDLDSGSVTSLDAWSLADQGMAESGAAYLCADDGWHWAGILDGSARDTDGAYLLTIGTDGERWVERYSSRDEAFSDLEHSTENAEREVEAVTPADFAQLVATMATNSSDDQSDMVARALQFLAPGESMARYLVGTTAIAQELGISPQRVRVLLSSGRIRGHRGIGGLWNVSPSELARFGTLPRNSGRPRKAPKEAPPVN